MKRKKQYLYRVEVMVLSDMKQIPNPSKGKGCYTLKQDKLGEIAGYFDSEELARGYIKQEMAKYENSARFIGSIFKCEQVAFWL